MTPSDPSEYILSASSPADPPLKCPQRVIGLSGIKLGGTFESGAVDVKCFTSFPSGLCTSHGVKRLTWVILLSAVNSMPLRRREGSLSISPHGFEAPSRRVHSPRAAKTRLMQSPSNSPTLTLSYIIHALIRRQSNSAPGASLVLTVTTGKTWTLDWDCFSSHVQTGTFFPLFTSRRWERHNADFQQCPTSGTV